LAIAVCRTATRENPNIALDAAGKGVLEAERVRAANLATGDVWQGPEHVTAEARREIKRLLDPLRNPARQLRSGMIAEVGTRPANASTFLDMTGKERASQKPSGSRQRLHYTETKVASGCSEGPGVLHAG